MKINKVLTVLMLSISFVVQPSQQVADPEARKHGRHAAILVAITEIKRQIHDQWGHLSIFNCIGKSGELCNPSNQVVLQVPKLLLNQEWEIPVASGLDKFKGTPVEPLVQHVLAEFEEKAVTSLVVEDDRNSVYHHFHSDAARNLVYQALILGQVFEINGKDYQCRVGKIVCKDDLKSKDTFGKYIEACRFLHLERVAE